MKKIVALSFAYLAPALALAQAPVAPGNAKIEVDYVNQSLNFVREFANAVLPVLIALAVLFFLWSLVMFILNSDDESARAAARSRMIWGVVIIFVMVSVWGLVNLLDESFGLDDTLQSVPPTPNYTNVVIP